MPKPIVKKFLHGEIGVSSDFTSVKYLQIEGPKELGAILAWKGEKSHSNNRHVRIDKNPTLSQALKNAEWVKEAIALGDGVGLGSQVRAGLSAYQIEQPAVASPQGNSSPIMPTNALYTPSCEDINETYQRRCRPGDEVNPEELLDWVEADLLGAGRKLAPAWRQIVRKRCLNLES